MTNLEIAKYVAKILDDKKGIDVKVIRIENISSLTDYLVIATGTSSTHVKALADEVEVEIKKAGIVPSHIEGHRSNSWILIDYNSVIVHVFSEEARDFYDLERLWKDGEQVQI